MAAQAGRPTQAKISPSNISSKESVEFLQKRADPDSDRVGILYL